NRNLAGGSRLRFSVFGPDPKPGGGCGRRLPGIRWRAEPQFGFDQFVIRPHVTTCHVCQGWSMSSCQACMDSTMALLTARDLNRILVWDNWVLSQQRYLSMRLMVS